MEKIDFKKTLKNLYGPSAKEFSVVDVPEMQFLMIDGHGDPNTARSYSEAVESLYAVAYKIKFTSKNRLERDYTVPPLEGLWWAEDMNAFAQTRNKDAWDWTMMIMQPDWITDEIFRDSVVEVRKKKDLPALPIIRLERYDEGLSVQIMHVGSYDDEGPVLSSMHNQFIPESGYRMIGKHHELYLSDPRKVTPDKLKTVLRQPVEGGTR
jgi:hypothetical protein